MKYLLQTVRNAYDWRNRDDLEWALAQIEQLSNFFGYLLAMKSTPTPDHVIGSIARVCHETNRQYCMALGDFSQLPWDDAPQWQRDSARTGVQLHLNNPETKASDSHASWMAEKVATGWVFGAVKDPAKKEHPCMVPFDELPASQRAKDFIFMGVVRGIAHEMIRK